MGLFDKKISNNDVLSEKANIVQSFLHESKTSLGFMSSGAVKATAKLLHHDEVVKYAIHANVAVESTGGKLKAKNYKLKGKEPGVVTVTNQRILFTKDVLGDSDNISIYLEDIDSVDSSGNIMTGAVLRIQSYTTAISVDGNKTTLNILRDKIDESIYLNKQGSITSAVVIQGTSSADEILKYKRLCDEGIITEEEFNIKKKQLIGS